MRGKRVQIRKKEKIEMRLLSKRKLILIYMLRKKKRNKVVQFFDQHQENDLVLRIELKKKRRLQESYIHKATEET